MRSRQRRLQQGVGSLQELHETLDKGKAFFLKNMLFLITMDGSASLQEHLLKIKDIRE
jgi:hypothetical protein